MTIARDRVIGIIFGNLIVALIFTQLWPVTVTRRIDPAIAAVLRKLASLSNERVNWKRWSLAAEAQAAIGAVNQDIELSAYEPLSVRPARTWIQCRERILSAIDSCLGPLLLAARSDRGRTGDLANRLCHLAQTLEGSGGANRALSRAPEYEADLVGSSLTRLEQAVACANEILLNREAEYAHA